MSKHNEPDKYRLIRTSHIARKTRVRLKDRSAMAYTDGKA